MQALSINLTIALAITIEIVTLSIGFLLGMLFIKAALHVADSYQSSSENKKRLTTGPAKIIKAKEVEVDDFEAAIS